LAGDYHLAKPNFQSRFSDLTLEVLRTLVGPPVSMPSQDSLHECSSEQCIAKEACRWLAKWMGNQCDGRLFSLVKCEADGCNVQLHLLCMSLLRVQTPWNGTAAGNLCFQHTQTRGIHLTVLAQLNNLPTTGNVPCNPKHFEVVRRTLSFDESSVLSEDPFEFHGEDLPAGGVTAANAQFIHSQAEPMQPLKLSEDSEGGENVGAVTTRSQTRNGASQQDQQRDNSSQVRLKSKERSIECGGLCCMLDIFSCFHIRILFLCEIPPGHAIRNSRPTRTRTSIFPQKEACCQLR
jgi:hypothetical protein